MNSQRDRSRRIRSSLRLVAPFPMALVAMRTASAAATGGAASAGEWTLLIIVIVFAATAGSAVLNVAAIRQWDRNWGLVSALPLFGLVLWIGIILTAKIIQADSHMLWTLEIFAWAMINMIYMVTAMTAKRMFARRDEEESSPP